VVVPEGFELVEGGAERLLDVARSGIRAFQGGFGERMIAVADAADLGEDHGAAAGSGIMREPGVPPFEVDRVVGDAALAFGQAPQHGDLAVR
jgi:hypothetical protein